MARRSPRGNSRVSAGCRGSKRLISARRESMLELQRVSTVYGVVPMLREVSLSVAAGELVCILGPNGAGKSTTFRAITGLVKSGTGTVTVAGQDVGTLGT